MNSKKRGLGRWGLAAAGLAILIGAIAVFSTGAPNGGSYVASLQKLVRGEYPVAASGALQGSGVIQADRAAVASPMTGRVDQVLVEEGDAVDRGQTIVQLSTERIDAELAAAEAGMAVAQAGLARAEAGARPGQIEVAKAELAQLETAVEAAQQAVTDTQRLVEEPQDLDLEALKTRYDLEIIEHQLEAAHAAMTDAKEGKNQAEWAIDEFGPEGDTVPFAVGEAPDGSTVYRDVWVGVPNATHLAHVYWWQAWVNINTKTAQREGLQVALAHLDAWREEPIRYERKRDEAQASLAETTTQKDLVGAKLDGLEGGASEGDLNVLRAQLAEAQAAYDALQRRRAQLKITAPMAGTVTEILLYPGEVASAGGSVVEISDLQDLRLAVYIPEAELGNIRLGQAVHVSVDSFPKEIFVGEVAYVSNEAEFTPRNVATQEERTTLVFAVEIAIDNADGRLKPGMPADAVFVE